MQLSLSWAPRSTLSKHALGIRFRSPLLAMGALGLVALAGSQPAQAGLVVQSFTTTETFSNFNPASATLQNFLFTRPQYTVQPFDASLGPLISATITWASSASFSGTVGNANTTSGSVGFSFGGNYRVDNISYTGNGSGGGNGATPGNTFTAGVSSFGSTKNFLASEAGITYDPNILTRFIGSSPFLIDFDNLNNSGGSPYAFSYTNIDSGLATVITNASVTYQFPDAPAPVPLLGAGAAWGWTRRLRRRCQSSDGGI
jgi:hypothetical protein